MESPHGPFSREKIRPCGTVQTFEWPAHSAFGRRVDDGRRGRRWHWPRAFSVCDRAPFAGPKDPLGDYLDGPAPAGHHSCGPVR